MKMRVADYIAEFLEKKGIQAAFMLSGGGMMHLMDALGRRKTLKFYCNHHEHACALSAEGYARKSGKLGVCYATSGPGASNTVTGVVECWQDSVPVLFLSGQSKLSQTIQGSNIPGLRQFGTFEVDIIAIVKSITKYAVFLNDPKKVRYHLEKAYYLATTGRPGPVFIDIPVDIQGALIDSETLGGFQPENQSAAALSVSVLDKLLDRISKSQRPLILAGHGVRSSNQVQQFQTLVQLLNIPVATTPLAADLMEYNDPLFIGHPGMKGDRPGNFAVQNADFILTLGCSLHVLTTGYELDRFAPKAYKVQVDLDAAVLQREQVGVHEKINASLENFLAQFGERLRKRVSQPQVYFTNPMWKERYQLWKKDLAVSLEPHAHQGTQLNFYDLIDALSEACPEGETVVADAGSAFYIVGQAFRVKKNQRVIISGALGAMGHALPLAIGAATADPAGQVLAVVGDGSFQTNVQELATIRHSRFNIKMFVVNNNGYVSIRNTQTNFFGGYLVGTSPESGVSFPSLEKLAAAYEIPYLVARNQAELQRLVKQALASKGPLLCEVFTADTQEILPTVSSYKREDGTMESKPLHDMFPFMDPERLSKYMC